MRFLWLPLFPLLALPQSASNPLAGSRDAVEAGRKLFAVSCATCHGPNGEGAQSHADTARPPDLTRGVYKAGNRDEDLFRVIAKGVTGSAMPSFETLGTSQIWRLVAFVRTLSRAATPSAGDPVAGEALFWSRGECGRCHQVGTRGVRLGPDLSRGSRRSTAAKLKRSIIAPNEEIRDEFALVTVVTRERQTITGLARFFDNFATRVVDLSGNEKTFLRDEIISIRRDMRSLMPDHFGTLFTNAELDDLVAYILKLRSEGAPR
jgi:putative heme-binding domain-containing protein